MRIADCKVLQSFPRSKFACALVTFNGCGVTYLGEGAGCGATPDDKK
jgi:hypothetical protein